MYINDGEIRIMQALYSNTALIQRIYASETIVLAIRYARQKHYTRKSRERVIWRLMGWEW